MTRIISKSMSGILEDLELDAQDYVTLSMLEELARKHGVNTNPSMIAQRLKKNGWLLPTTQRGVWEFAPASRAGAFSRNDPLKDIIAFTMVNPDTRCFLCLQTAAWALGLADRIPSCKELAFSVAPKNRIPDGISVFRYNPTIQTKIINGVNCLAPESIIVHLATKPQTVSSWDSTMEWIPDVVYEIDIDKLMKELSNRNDSIKRRTGYLLQGMYPKAADVIQNNVTIKSKIRFGPRTAAIRNDERWMIADTILPLSPKEMEFVK